MALTDTQPREPIATIPHAATVVILRDTPDGPQVLMTKRAAGLTFMANLWVFPGGRMESSDQSPEVLARIDTTELAGRENRLISMQGAPLDATTMHGLHVAACRETFEEAGVLLGGPAAGGACDAAQLARLTLRRADASTAAGFVRLLVDEDLVLNVGHLTYWAHWITPAREGKRFDTRFFAVEWPADQEASADLSELTEHAWLSEADLEAGIRRDELLLAPPTRVTLQDLWDSHRHHGSVERMLRAEQSRAVPPVMPKILASGAKREVVLPWDPEYATAPGEGLVSVEGYPPHLTRLPSRWTPWHAVGRRDRVPDDTAIPPEQ